MSIYPRLISLQSLYQSENVIVENLDFYFVELIDSIGTKKDPTS